MCVYVDLVRYVAAATGPKDVVLVLDVSGSMSQQASSLTSETRLEMMQKAAKRVLKTLTHNDYVAVVRWAACVVAGLLVVGC